MKRFYSALLTASIALTLGSGQSANATIGDAGPTLPRDEASPQEVITGGWVDYDHWYVFSTTFKSLDACRRMGAYQVNHGDDADIFGAYRCERAGERYSLKLFYYGGVV